MNIQIRTASGKIKETVVVRKKTTTTAANGKRIAWAIDWNGQVYRARDGQWRAYDGPAPKKLIEGVGQ